MSNQLPDAVATEDEAMEVADTRTPLKIGMRVLTIGFGGFLLWAAFAPLDEGVPTPGLVSVATKRKPIQHQLGGIIKDVLVREGQLVRSGQTLVRLDDGLAKANFEAARQHFMGLKAMESRLVAEQMGYAEIRFPDEVIGSQDATVQQQVATQQSLFYTRRSAFDAQLSAMTESMMGQRAMVDAYRGEMEARREQIASLREDLRGVRDLVSEGYIPKSRERELQRQLAANEGAMTELSGNLARTIRSISEIQRKIVQARQEYRAQGESQLAAIRLELQADREKFKAAGDELARTNIRAPVAGQVVGIQFQSKGAVLQPAQKLMDIVPNNEELVIETKIPPHLADRVREGQSAEVQFSTFANSPAVVVDGRIRSVSRDLLSEATPNGVTAYYSAQVVVTRQGIETLGRRQMRPGMPVEVIIKTGKRTLLQYLFKPLMQRMNSAMREE